MLGFCVQFLILRQENKKTHGIGHPWSMGVAQNSFISKFPFSAKKRASLSLTTVKDLGTLALEHGICSVLGPGNYVYIRARLPRVPKPWQGSLEDKTTHMSSLPFHIQSSATVSPYVRQESKRRAHLDKYTIPHVYPQYSQRQAKDACEHG